MPVMSDREYRMVDATGLELRTEQDGGLIVEGYAATFDQEYPIFSKGDYEIREAIASGAFDGTDMRDVIMQYDHTGRVIARTSNGTLNIIQDTRGLRIRANLGGTELGRQLFDEIKGGYTTRMSFGFKAGAQERRVDAVEKRTIIHRRILSFKKLYDVSAVSLPANDATEICARNLGEGVIAEIEKELLAEKERARHIQRIRIMLEV